MIETGIPGRCDNLDYDNDNDNGYYKDAKGFQVRCHGSNPRCNSE